MPIRQKMMFLSLVMCLAVVGCRQNPFAVYYVDYTAYHGGLTKSNLRGYQGRPDMIATDNPQEEEKKLFEEGYRKQGVTKFSKCQFHPAQAQAHGSRIHAEKIVLAYNPDGFGFTIKDITGSSEYNPQVYASFWNKMIHLPPFGAKIRPLNDQEKQAIESNKGVAIVTTVKGTPAYENDIVVGDIIRKFNGIPIESCEQLIRLIRQNQGKNINIEINRKGKTVIKNFKLIGL